MASKLKKLNEQVIVITGATSGIGLATARMAAEAGAKLVLVAREGDALDTLAHEMRQRQGMSNHVAESSAYTAVTLRSHKIAPALLGLGALFAAWTLARRPALRKAFG